jgi:hypothetical protein
MTTGAIIMMVIAILVVWGGLAIAILNLRRGDDASEQIIHRDL